MISSASSEFAGPERATVAFAQPHQFLHELVPGGALLLGQLLDVQQAARLPLDRPAGGEEGSDIFQSRRWRDFRVGLGLP